MTPTMKRLTELRNAHWEKLRKDNPRGLVSQIDEISILMAMADLVDEKWGKQMELTDPAPSEQTPGDRE